MFLFFFYGASSLTPVHSLLSLPITICLPCLTLSIFPSYLYLWHRSPSTIMNSTPIKSFNPFHTYIFCSNFSHIHSHICFTFSFNNFYECLQANMYTFLLPFFRPYHPFLAFYPHHFFSTYCTRFPWQVHYRNISLSRVLSHLNFISLPCFPPFFFHSSHFLHIGADLTLYKCRDPFSLFSNPFFAYHPPIPT